MYLTTNLFIWFVYNAALRICVLSNKAKCLFCTLAVIQLLYMDTFHSFTFGLSFTVLAQTTPRQYC